MLRLFIAAYPPKQAVTSWLETAREMLPGNIPLSNAHSVHLTIVFLGERYERDLPNIRESVSRSLAGFGPFLLTPGELVMLPDRGSPRLLAAITNLPPPLAEIQRRLAQRLALDRRRTHAFVPHLTIARFPGRVIERATRLLSDTAFEINEIRLMRSRLHAQGAVHELDKAFPLQPL